MNDQAELTAVAVPEDIEEPSFQAFFSEHYDRLARALFLLAGEPGEAEDLAQEAMVRVYERWGRVSTMTLDVTPTRGSASLPRNSPTL